MQNSNTNIFLNKNILVLYPTDDNEYCRRFDLLKKHIKNTILFNFVDYSHSYGIKNTEKYVLDTIDNEKIDIVISYPFATDYQLSVEFYNSLKKKTKIVFWFSDDASYFDSYSKYYIQIADVVITSDYFAVFAYKRLGISAILCLETVVNNKLLPVEIEKDIDVCFIGDIRKRGRKEHIKFLTDNGIDVQTFGFGSDYGYLPGDKISEYFCRSKINLNFTQIGKLNWTNADEPLLNLVRQNNGRPIEIALTKSFCLSEYSPALDTIFAIGKEIDVFHNQKELLEKIRYYLSNPEKREEIAANAYQRARENYKPDIYIPKALKSIMQLLENNNQLKIETNELYLSNNFKVKTINGLTFSMFVMIKNCKIRYALETFFTLFKYGFVNFLIGFYGGIIRIIQTKFKK